MLEKSIKINFKYNTDEKVFRNLFGISELESSAERLELLSKKQIEDFERYETTQKEREQLLADLLNRVQGDEHYLNVVRIKISNVLKVIKLRSLMKLYWMKKLYGSVLLTV